jgi:hypothetical protein
MEVLEKHGVAHLLGEIIAAELVDAIDHPVTSRELADFAQSPAGKRLRKRRARNRTARPRAGGEIVNV